MPKAIDVAMVEARLRDLAATSVNQTVSLFKGGVFALAAVMLVEIAFANDDRVIRLVLWAATVCMVMTSYNAWINSTVTLFREGLGNIVAMIVQGMIELMLFAILTPRPVMQAWRYWAAASAVFFFVTGARLATRMNRGAAVEPAAQPLFDLVHKNRIAASRIVFTLSAVCVLVAVPVILLPGASPWPRWLCLGLAALNTVAAILAMVSQEQEREAMDSLLAPPEK